MLRCGSMRWILSAAAGGLVLAAVACGMSTSELTAADRPEGPPPSGLGGDPGPLASSGVVLAHAAVFPTMRLCFGKHMDMRPQPDTQVMPESNVVGIEIGNVARIPALDDVGEVYVVDERIIRSGPAAGRTCAELICEGSGCLRENLDYKSIGTIDGSLGKDSVEVLAISGCPNAGVLANLGVAAQDCPQPYDPAEGNLKFARIPLTRSDQATATRIPALVLNLSPRLDALRGAAPDGGADGGTVAVTFGALAEQGTLVATNPPLFATSPQTTLEIEPTDAVYASHGFRILLDDDELARQSLASVQEMSSPDDVPSTYYHLASNYALLLLGDPAVRPTLDDGGANPSYDGRKGLHVIAVPVLDPSLADAGADADVSADASSE